MVWLLLLERPILADAIGQQRKLLLAQKIRKPLAIRVGAFEFPSPPTALRGATAHANGAAREGDDVTHVFHRLIDGRFDRLSRSR